MAVNGSWKQWIEGRMRRLLTLASVVGVEVVARLGATARVAEPRSHLTGLAVGRTGYNKTIQAN